jgi:hypothetical protein
MVACIDFFEMSEICRPKFIVRHSTINPEIFSVRIEPKVYKLRGVYWVSLWALF